MKKINTVFCIPLLAMSVVLTAMESKLWVTTIVTNKNVIISEQRGNSLSKVCYDCEYPNTLTTDQGQEELKHDFYQKLTKLCPKRSDKDYGETLYELEFRGYYTTEDPRLKITEAFCWKINSGGFGEGEFWDDNCHQEELEQCKKILTGCAE